MPFHCWPATIPCIPPGVRRVEAAPVGRPLFSGLSFGALGPVDVPGNPVDLFGVRLTFYFQVSCMHTDMCVCVCVRMHVRVCVHVGVLACVYMCACGRAYVSSVCHAPLALPRDHCAAWAPAPAAPIMFVVVAVVVLLRCSRAIEVLQRYVGML
jgi:hypothetical protein